MHGEYGVLASDGDRVQCHECGAWYRALGTHVLHKHGMTAAQYKREHGLPQGTALVAADVSEAIRASAIDRSAHEQMHASPRWAQRGPRGPQEHGHVPIVRERIDAAARAGSARRRKYSDAQVVEMRVARDGGEAVTSIAQRYDADPTTVSDYCTGKRRRAAGGPITPSIGAPSSRSPTVGDVSAWRRLHDGGWTVASIARYADRSPAVIRRALDE